MNYYEAEIEKYSRRIKRIEANPDPTMLFSNKLRYQLELKNARDMLQAWRDGKPFADGPAPALLRSLGFEHLDLGGSADRSQLAPQHFDTIRSLGFSDEACDRTIVSLAMVIRGELPSPSLMVTGKWTCDPFMLSYNALGRWYDVPVFFVDFALEANPETLKYVAEQYGELIEFAERSVPGIKYDEGRLIELQEMDRQAFAYLRDIYELRKRLPCPIAGKDAFRLPRIPSRSSDPRLALEYYRIWRDEMQERAEKGMSAVKEEKLRVLWAVSGPFYANPFEVLERRGVSIPWFHYDLASRWAAGKFGVYGDEAEYGKKLTPVEEEARMTNCHAWGSLAQRWVDDTLDICRELSIDAIINFVQIGCTATGSLFSILEDEAKKQLGILTLNIEGRQLDPAYFDEKAVSAQLELFVDRCLMEKEQRN